MIEKQNVSVDTIAKRIITDQKLLEEAIAGITSDKPQIKYKSGKVLMKVSEDAPEVIYHEWERFITLLNNDNTFMRTIGVTIISNLALIDDKKKFDKKFNKIYSLLNDESMITTATLVGRSGVIAKAKPELQTRITNKLLGIDGTQHTSECKNIIKGKAILAFNEYYEIAKNKKKILDFVRNELGNTRTATRKKAEKFLRKWDKK